MIEQREQLIDLLADHCDMRDGRCAPCDNDCKTSRFGKMADHLLSNGVVVPLSKVATLRAFRSPHGTVNVVIQNCSPEVSTLLWRFDIWNSNGRFEYDENKPKERARIWFECPIEFLDFISSDMGKACFERMGVQKFYIAC